MLSHLWEYLYVNLCSLFPSDECIFTAINVYSRYPEAVFVKDTSSKSLIKRLESIFSKHGYPMTLKTNNGSNHISVEMEKYFQKESIIQNQQLLAKNNREVQHYNRTFLKSILAIHMEGKDWQSHFNSKLCSTQWLSFKKTCYNTGRTSHDFF